MERNQFILISYTLRFHPHQSLSRHSLRQRTMFPHRRKILIPPSPPTRRRRRSPSYTLFTRRRRRAPLLQRNRRRRHHRHRRPSCLRRWGGGSVGSLDPCPHRAQIFALPAPPTSNGTWGRRSRLPTIGGRLSRGLIRGEDDALFRWLVRTGGDRVSPAFSSGGASFDVFVDLCLDRGEPRGWGEELFVGCSS